MMSFNVWNFALNELCDLKNLKKLISGLCPSPIIQYYINNLKKYIYKHDLHKMHCGLHIFLLIYFTIYNYLLFSKVTTFYFSIILYTCVHPMFFFTIFKNWKTKYTLLKTTRWYVGYLFFRIFSMCIFNPADFSLSCFEVAVWFSKFKF